MDYKTSTNSVLYPSVEKTNGAVNEAMLSLRARAEMVAKLTEEVLGRARPVLREEGPMVMGKQTDIQTPSSVPLAEQMQTANGVLAVAERNLNDLLSRLEI